MTIRIPASPPTWRNDQQQHTHGLAREFLKTYLAATQSPSRASCESDAVSREQRAQKWRVFMQMSTSKCRDHIGTITARISPGASWKTTKWYERSVRPASFPMRLFADDSKGGTGIQMSLKAEMPLTARSVSSRPSSR